MKEKKHNINNCVKSRIFNNIIHSSNIPIKLNSNDEKTLYNIIAEVAIGLLTYNEIVKYYKSEKKYNPPKFLEREFDEHFYIKKYMLMMRHVEYYKEYNDIQGKRAKCNSL